MVGSLWELCEVGDLEGVRAALGRGEEVNQRGGRYQRTGLMVAAYRGHRSTVELLLQQPGLEVDLTARDGYTALHWACVGGQGGVVARLLDHPSLTSLNTRDDSGSTPLMLAVSWGNVSCVRELVGQSGVELETRDSEGRGLEEVAREGDSLEAWQVVREELGRRK